jgi:hypothetical protein
MFHDRSLADGAAAGQIGHQHFGYGDARWISEGPGNISENIIFVVTFMYETTV